MDMSKNTAFSVLLVGVLMGLVASSQAYDFNVGGRDGWVSNPSESYSSWAGRNRFQINDTLVFKYKSGADSVLVVTKKAFDTCNLSNPIQKLEGGNSAFSFDRNGPFYFISGVAENCQKGQKLVVVVLADRSKQHGQSPPSLSPPVPISPSPAPAVLAGSPSPAPPAHAPASSPVSSPSASPVSSPSSISPAASPSSTSPISSPSSASPVSSPPSISPAASPSSTSPVSSPSTSPISSPSSASPVSSPLPVYPVPTFSPTGAPASPQPFHSPPSPNSPGEPSSATTASPPPPSPPSPSSAYSRVTSTLELIAMILGGALLY